MRGYFDDEEPEAERPRRDTELTLGSGALLAMFFGLVLICGLCFGLGYALGHHTSSPAASTPARNAAQTAAPDEEPLQGNSSTPKPSALAQVPVPPPSDAAQTPATDAGATPPPTQPSPAPAEHSSPPAQAPAAPAQTQVRPAMPAAASTPQSAQSAAAPSVHPALPATVSLMVQIAAVANSEDANVLVSALLKRGYAVTARREPADGLIHVRIGPFNSRDEANRMCMKLLNDGYNAIIQP
jgi:cell division protein FtsN